MPGSTMLADILTHKLGNVADEAKERYNSFSDCRDKTSHQESAQSLHKNEGVLHECYFSHSRRMLEGSLQL